jgi:hypothetical protein
MEYGSDLSVRMTDREESGDLEFSRGEMDRPLFS